MDVVSNFLKDNIHHKSMQKKNYPDVCCICCWSENEKFSGGSHLDSKITQDQDSAVLHACMLNEAGRANSAWVRSGISTLILKNPKSASRKKN